MSVYPIVTEWTSPPAANERTMRGQHEVDWGIDMSSRIRRDRLEVKHTYAPKDDVPTVVRPEPIPPQPGSTDLPYVEPEEYGLRVNWESEPVELGDVAVPLLVQESSNRRLARVMARMRDQLRSERGTTEPGA